MTRVPTAVVMTGMILSGVAFAAFGWPFGDKAQVAYIWSPAAVQAIDERYAAHTAVTEQATAKGDVPFSIGPAIGPADRAAPPVITIDGCIVSGDGFMLDLRQVTLIARAASDRRYMPEGGVSVSLGGDSRTLPLPESQQDAVMTAWKAVPEVTEQAKGEVGAPGMSRFDVALLHAAAAGALIALMPPVGFSGWNILGPAVLSCILMVRSMWQFGTWLRE